ncbi:MAG: hypothetical protein M3R27_13910 [Bacteroidota bacterium]|nr:hypothetical protein [Bacteroidota bacterium]
MRLFLVILFFTFLCGCMSSVNEASEISAESSESKDANKFMWNNLHSGNYDSIPAILKKLNSANAENPEDGKITAHLGFVHLWAFSERIRKPSDEEITKHVFLSNMYFKKAIDINPSDARLHGFQAATEMCEGAISKDPIMIATGYGKGINAIDKWPQFNKFAISFVESLQGKNSPMFKQGLKFQWELLDECSTNELTQKMIEEDPVKILTDLINEVKRSEDPAISRACWNSWIAPHNLEGFFLNLGDMLVKAGEIETAKKIYAAARLTPSFNEWPYKSLVEDRIKNAERNYKSFNESLELIHITNKNQIFINSSISCVGCHQMSPAEFKRYGYQEPKPSIYTLIKN